MPPDAIQPSTADVLAFRIPALFLLLFSVGCSRAELSDIPAASSQPALDSTLAIINVHVVPMTADTVLADHAVLVTDGTITAVAPTAALTIPAGTPTIDGQSAYLMPGLVDAHVHLRSTDELLSYVAHGVTSVIHMSGAMGGAPDLLRYRREIASGERIGPAMYVSGPILDGDPPIFRGVSRVVTTPDQARAAVAEQHAAGYDFIKVYNNLEPEVLRAVVDAAHERGMAVAGHIPRAGGRAEALQRALSAGLDLIAHGEEYFFTYAYAGVDSMLDRGEAPTRDSLSIAEAVRLTAESGAAVTPNLSFIHMTRRQLDDFETVLGNPEARFLHPDVRSMWEKQNPTRRSDVARFDLRERAKYVYVQQLTKKLQEAGVPLLLGTDASAPGMYPGATVHLELRELVAAGLSPYEALATGTRTAGRFIADYVPVARPFGVIAPGARADLSLVRGNPLEDVSHAAEIEGVMVRGDWYPRDGLERRRAERAASY